MFTSQEQNAENGPETLAGRIRTRLFNNANQNARKSSFKKNTFLLFHFFKYRSNEPIQWRALINFPFIRAWQNLRKKLNELGPRTLMTKLQFFISIGRPGGHHLTAMLYRDDSIIF